MRSVPPTLLDIFGGFRCVWLMTLLQSFYVTNSAVK